jgi:lipid-A-disaccharide synthase
MRVWICAGEASGDILGGRLMAALRRAASGGGVEFAGVGGDRMAEQGLDSLFPMRELALMGLLEVLPNIRRLARRMDQAQAAIAARRPDVLVTIDAPSFTLRLAERVRPLGLRVVHYVAPQVWAWRPGRVRRMRERVDRILALLPFEPAFFEAAGIPVTFVGHPVLESGADAGDAAGFRAAHGLGGGERPVIVMPGSRRTEVRRLLPAFGAALEIAARDMPGLRPVVAVGALVRGAVEEAARGWPAAPILVTDPAEKHDAFAAMAAAGGAGLIKSGTSSLEMAVAGIPHVVGYRVNPVTAAIVRRLIRVPHASLVNLLAGREVVPERLQQDCTPEALAEALLRPMRDPAVAAAQRAGFAEVLARLRPPGGGLPSEAAARAVLEVAAA